jgi:hypothetical protein
MKDRDKMNREYKKYIKTAREIYIDTTTINKDDKWVSLAWLKERRKKQTPGRFLDIIDSLEG